MCLVSFVPFERKTIISSNRDETILRPSPKLVQLIKGKKQLYFPQDSKGGSWICHDDQGNLMVLLNGAFERHKRQEPYRKSRGLILIELMVEDDPILAWESYSLENIEPFTLIHFSQEKELYELNWDGEMKYQKVLNSQQVHCWMSSTLYKRIEWEERSAGFAQMLAESYSEETIMKFHNMCRYKYKMYGWTIKTIQTVSHTKAHIEGNNIDLNYQNLR